MRKELKQILKNSLSELDGDDSAIVDSIKLVAALLFSSTGLLEPVPRRIFGWEHEGNEFMPFPFYKKPENERALELEFFPQRAILLHDGLHAAAHGRTKFMYRAKGQRLYLFENGDLMPVSIAAQVDRHGLFLNKDLIEDFGLNVNSLVSSDIEWARVPFDFMLNDPNEDNVARFVIQDLIRILCNIKEPFKRAYLLEHLLIPPDVDTISSFSANVREKFWDICLSKEFEDDVGFANQNTCMNILSTAEIPPAPQQIVSFVRQLSRHNKGMDEILERLKQFEASMSNKFEKIDSKLQNQSFWQDLFSNLGIIKNKNGINHCLLTKIEDVETVVLQIVDQFKQLVENNGLWKELWDQDDKPRHEASAQNLFFLMAHSYCKANNIDLTPEANSGNGPVDFKMSHGYQVKAVVEIKLSTNTSLIHGYEKQLEIYKAADETDVGIFLVIDVGGLGKKLEKVKAIHDDAVKLNKRVSHIRYVDGLQKDSASKR